MMVRTVSVAWVTTGARGAVIAPGFANAFANGFANALDVDDDGNDGNNGEKRRPIRRGFLSCALSVIGAGAGAGGAL